jgi:hypothetical protein
LQSCKVAFIGYGSDAYWARLAKLRIVAEIMDANNGSKEFWIAPEEVKQNVYGVLAQTSAKLVVTFVLALSARKSDKLAAHRRNTLLRTRPLQPSQ